MSSVAGKTVLITGSASGIGLATATEFARAGSTLILTDRDAEALWRATDAIGRTGTRVLSRVVDVTDERAVSELATFVSDELGGLDVLINNAGIGYQARLSETSLDTWRRLINVNLLGPLYHIYAFLPGMQAQRSGQIVNISSGQAFFRLPTWGAYASVKAALAVMSEILHWELRGSGITVTTVYPFLVRTHFYDDLKPSTWGTRLQMQILPFISYAPETVAHQVFEAVRRKKRVELASLLNELGFYAQVVPALPTVIGRLSALVLGR